MNVVPQFHRYRNEISCCILRRLFFWTVTLCIDFYASLIDIIYCLRHIENNDVRIK